VVRRYVAPRWLGGHLAVLALCVAFALLGRWQWGESQAPGGDFQNFAYAIQWWLFIAIALAWYGKIIRDDARPRRSAPTATEPPAAADGAAAQTGLGKQVLVAAGRVEPTRPAAPAAASPADQAADEELVQWNAWLAELNAKPGR
jgi:DNA-binding transcriptional regulator of glucitol operon